MYLLNTFPSPCSFLQSFVTSLYNQKYSQHAPNKHWVVSPFEVFSELSAELLGLPLLCVKSVLGVLQLLDDFFSLLHVLGQLVVLLSELLVLPAELHHQLAQLLALPATVQLQLLHLPEGHLHALHQAFQFFL